VAYVPDDTLLALNEAINHALDTYLNADDGQEESSSAPISDGPVQIIFELPNPDETPAEPTVSVFLYDIQEDLALRHNEVRPFANGKLNPGYVHVRCCYLVTYWDPDSGNSGAPITGPRSQAMQIMNKVLNALINNRTFAAMNAYTRIIPPSEQLNSLGNFWQSMGDKPRLSLSYMVTVPVRLRDRNDSMAPIVAEGTGAQVKPLA